MRRKGDDQRGATMVEYALMIGLVALVAIGGVTLFGEATNDLFGLMPAGL